MEKILALKPEFKHTFSKQKEQQKIADSAEQVKIEKQKSLLPKLREGKQESAIDKTKEVKSKSKETIMQNNLNYWNNR